MEVTRQNQKKEGEGLNLALVILPEYEVSQLNVTSK